jgi:hypothetical protein
LGLLLVLLLLLVVVVVLLLLLAVSTEPGLPPCRRRCGAAGDAANTDGSACAGAVL